MNDGKTKIIVYPIFGDDDRKNIDSENFSIIGLYITSDAERDVVLNIGFPEKAQFNQALGNLFGFSEENGMYFVTGEVNYDDRPGYLISYGDSLVIDSYAQINAPFIGEHDLIDVIKTKSLDNKKSERKIG